MKLETVINNSRDLVFRDRVRAIYNMIEDLMHDYHRGDPTHEACKELERVKAELVGYAPFLKKYKANPSTRATFHVSKKHLANIRARAYHERRPIKDVLDDALNKYFKDKK